MRFYSSPKFSLQTAKQIALAGGLLLALLLLPLPPLLPAAAASASVSAEVADKDEKAMQQVLQAFFRAERGEHAAAAAELAKIGRARQSAELMRRAVVLMLHAQKIPEALAFAKDWDAFGGEGAKIVVAELSVVSGHYEEAVALYRAILATKSVKPLSVAKALSKVPNHDVRLDMAQRIFDTADDEQHAVKIRIALSTGAVGKARAWIDEFANPQSLVAVFWRAETLRAMGVNATQLPVLDELVANGCYGAAMLCERAVVLAAYARFIKSKDDWQYILNPPPPDSDVKLDENLPMTKEQQWLAAGQLLVQWQHYDEAVALFQEIGDVFTARYAWAKVVEAREGYAAALAVLQDAKVKNQSELVTRELAIMSYHRQLGQVAEALAVLERANEKVPDNFNILYEKSFLLEASGQVREAVALLTRMSQQFPKRDDVWNALGYTMANHNIDLPQAQEYIEHALDLRPNEQAYLDSLGWVLYRQGRYEDALVYLRRAALGKPFAEISAHLGEVLWEMGNREEAKQVWRDAQRIDPDDKTLQETLQRYNPF